MARDGNPGIMPFSQISPEEHGLATLNIFSAGAAQAVVMQIAEKFQRENANLVNAEIGRAHV